MAGAVRAFGMVVAAFMLTLVSSVGAVAGQVTVDFSGTVTLVNASKISGTKVGDRFSGTLVYDSSTTKTSLPGADPAVYTALSPLASGLGITLNVGGTTYAAEAGYAGQLMVGYHLGGTFPDVFTALASVNVGGAATTATFGVADRTGTVFSSTALPTSLDLSKFSVGKFGLEGPPDSANIFEGTISLVQAASVPEPGSAVLLSIGALAGGCVVRLRRVRLRRICR